jgi:hypothetical protein
MKESSNRRYLIIAGVIFLGAFLRLSDSPPSSLWTDEFATYWISSAPGLSECIERANPTQGQSPFYYILEWCVLQTFQHNEFSLRLLSLTASLISIYLIYSLAALLFNKVDVNAVRGGEEAEEPGGLGVNRGAFYPAIFAALLFALNESSIYYAQEARPYAVAVMFSLLSQIFFLKLLRKYSRKSAVGYIIFSSLVCYTHYVFGTVLLFQNIWVLYLLLKKWRSLVSQPDKSDSEIEDRDSQVPALNSGELLRSSLVKDGGVSVFGWCTIQVGVLLTLLPLSLHLLPIIRNSGKWTWLSKSGFSSMISLFTEMMDLKFIFFSLSLFVFLLTMKNFTQLWRGPSKCDDRGCLCFNRVFCEHSKGIFIFLIIWLITPPFFAYFATKLLKSSLIDQRYMILSYLPLFLLGAWCLSVLKTAIAKKLFIALIVIFYSVNVLIPNFLNEAHFSRRIMHDWRGALKYVKSNIHSDDSIILRSGFIKENWVPDTKNSIIKEYVQAPLRSFYFKGAKFADIYNLTFSPSREFQNYYRKIFAKLADSERVWLVGVSKPNGFPIANIPDLLMDTHNIDFK